MIETDRLQRLIYTNANHIWFMADIEDETVAYFGDRFNSVVSEISQYKGVNNSPIQVPIVLHIASYGGCMYSGFDMAKMIESSPARVHTVACGVVASSGTYPLLAGDKRYATENSAIMIHEHSWGAWGRHSIMKDNQEGMEIAYKQLVDFYAKRTKLTRKNLKKILKGDKWFSPDKAVKLGFVDSVI